MSHAAEVRRQKVSDGSWKPNVTRAEVAKNVTEDLREIWMKVPIPLLDFWVSYKKVKKVLEEGDKLLKIPIERRTSNFSRDELNFILDIASCKHLDDAECDCIEEKRVPNEWKKFLEDQRGSRRMTLSDQVDYPASMVATQAAVRATKTQERRDRSAERIKRQRGRNLRENPLIEVNPMKYTIVIVDLVQMKMKVILSLNLNLWQEAAE